MRIRMNLETVVCRTQTDRHAFGGDTDEFYVVTSTGLGINYARLGEQKIGDYERGDDRRIDLIIYDGDVGTDTIPYVRFTFRDSDDGEPQYGGDDYIGEFTVHVQGGGISYAAGRDSDDYRRTDSGAQEFLIHGSGSNYTVYVKEQIR